MKRATKVSEYLKYEFGNEEQRENAQVLARKTRSLAEFELKKKQLNADLKQEQDKLNAEIALAARYVTDGYDFRMIECGIRYDSPSIGLKIVYRIDTGEEVKTERMADHELQASLPLEEVKPETDESSISLSIPGEEPFFEGTSAMLNAITANIKAAGKKKDAEL